MKKSRGLAPKVVIHLAGTGDKPTSPIRITGIHLVLVFWPPKYGEPALRLTPKDRAAVEEGALFETSDGTLELIGGAIHFLDHKLAALPSYMFKLIGANLKLTDCRLEGPLHELPDSYKGLIRFEGAGETNPLRTPTASIAGTALISGVKCLDVHGTGAGFQFENSVVVAGAEAFSFDPGATASALNLHLSLDRTTVAVKDAFIHLHDVSIRACAEPIYVQAKYSVFTDPFTDGLGRAGLLAFEKAGFQRGLVAWQGQNNIYDQRLRYYLRSLDEPLPSEAHPYTVWARSWGGFADRQPLLDLGLRHDLRIDEPALAQLEALSLPKYPRSQSAPLPGADLTHFGVAKKAPKK